MFAGEVQRVAMKVSNIGPVSLSHLAVVSSEPSWLTVGNSLWSDSQSVFSTTDCVSNEPSIVTKSLTCKTDFINQLAVACLEAHCDVITLPLWIHAPDTSGSAHSQWLFYYEATQPTGGKMR